MPLLTGCKADTALVYVCDLHSPFQHLLRDKLVHTAQVVEDWILAFQERERERERKGGQVCEGFLMKAYHVSVYVFLPLRVPSACLSHLEYSVNVSELMYA